MNTKTKILLGVGALAVVGYFVWKNNQSKDIFANATGRIGKKNRTANRTVTCGRSDVKIVTRDGYTYCTRQDSTYTLYDPNGNQIK